MANAKRILPPNNLRPPISGHLHRHREGVAALNDFYWGVRAGFHALIHAAQQGATTTDRFLPPDIGARWSMPVGDVPTKVSAESMRLRQVIITQAVTYYEDYLQALLLDHLCNSPLPHKKPRLQIDLASLPSGVTVEDFIRPIYAKDIADEILSGNYEKRAKKLHKRFQIDPLNTTPSLNVDLVGVAAAGEVRNNVVHCGGIADQRAVAALKPIMPTTTLGSVLPLDESTLFRLTGALKDHVEAIDLLVRIK